MFFRPFWVYSSEWTSGATSYKKSKASSTRYKHYKAYPNTDFKITSTVVKRGVEFSKLKASNYES